MIIAEWFTNVETHATVQLPLGKKVIVTITQRLFTGWTKGASTRASDHHLCYVIETMYSLFKFIITLFSDTEYIYKILTQELKYGKCFTNYKTNQQNFSDRISKDILS